VTRRRAALIVLAAGAALAGQPLAGQNAAPSASVEWRTHGHDPGGMRFSGAAQITPQNVGDLEVAWVYHMRPADAPRLAGGETTPLVVNGVMYVSTPYARVVALDPTTGKERWVFTLPAGQPPLRGVEYWPGDGQVPPQVVFASSTGRLYSLDAATGVPRPGFGDGGSVNLNTPEVVQGLPGNIGASSPPIVYRNFVITGSRTPEAPAQGPAGDVRAWDMRSGRLVWTFKSIPGPGERFHETWEGDSWKNRTGVSVWGLLTVDAQRGIVYMPFGAPSNDRYGGDRLGDNLFSSSVVAADANTGKYLWHFQVVHHDIWDFDVANPPLLLEVRTGGRTIPAVAVMSKSGLLFLLDRVTGTPIYGVEERPVPKSELPMERASPTQPFPLKPPPLSRQTFTAADIATVTPELEAACRKLIEGMQLGGPYLPLPYNRLRVQFPGFHGGVNWGGAAYSPQLGYLFVNTNELGQIQGYTDREPAAEAAPGGGGPGGGRGRPGPYRDLPGGGRFRDNASNMMCQQPPWGQLIAVNVHTGEFAWRVPLGVTDSLPLGKQKTGRPGNGGPIATAGGVVFIGATDDNRFRAFDARTGSELWAVKLAAAAHATPSTYMGADGRQYVVITSTGGGFLNAPIADDSITAFALRRAPRASAR
jgi:quinoprotein glucose dehydrogenase